jgi:outer membrane lipoprotein-sorting protein
MGIMVAVVFACSAAYAAPTVDEVLKMMGDKDAKVKTMQADMTMAMESPMGPMKAAGKMCVSKTEVDGKTVRKSLTTMKMTMEAEGMSMTMDNKMVNDGTFMWHEMRNSMNPMVTVMKMRAGQAGPGQGPGADVEESVEQLKKQFDFTKVGEDTIDGRKMYVLEGTLKEEMQKGSPMTGARYYLDAETLVVRRTVMLDKAGKEMGRMDLTNVKLNEAVDAKTFEYTPPAGAQVRDMTGK